MRHCSLQKQSNAAAVGDKSAKERRQFMTFAPTSKTVIPSQKIPNKKIRSARSTSAKA